MTDIFDNAITSIKTGIEDYQADTDERLVSAVRNFYSGVLLLGKECLLLQVPDEDPMDVLASKFTPYVEDGELLYKPRGHQTVDLQELQSRFKDFGLVWPEGGSIKPLQKLRNNIEHYHSPEPKEAFKQAIANCFPIVAGFFDILEKVPVDELGDSWGVMLEVEDFFKKQKEECDNTFKPLPWFDQLEHTEYFQCPVCDSSLIIQTNDKNNDPALIEGRCFACGEEINAEKTVSLIVEAEYGIDDFIAAKDGGEAVIHDCHECHQPTLVFNHDINMCFFCDNTIGGECSICSEPFNPHNQSVSNPDLCDYCDHKLSKIDRE